jgi:betaine-aldehyde dehydrogenase
MAGTFHDRITGAPLGAVTATSLPEVDGAIGAAARALAAWGADAAARASVLLRWADALEAEADALADLIVGEVGKIAGEARREVLLSADALRYNAGAGRRLDGQGGVMDDGSIAYVERVPVGVASFIVPWNTPVLLLFRDLAPALAAGVTAVVKPSPDAPLSIARCLALGRAAGLPDGVAAVVQGGADVGARLVTHPDVRAVAFTGSAGVGAAVMQAAAPDFTRVLLELGGKGASVILDDADLDAAVAASVAGACFTSGQMCMAVTRILAERRVYDDVLAAVADGMRAVALGDPRDPATRMGPLITHAHRERVATYVDLARTEARLVCGGGPLAGSELPFLAPAVVADVDPASRLVQEEIFGPVVTVERFDGDAGAIALANASPFGLSASVWTRDVDRGWRVARGIQAGTVWVNGFGGLFAAVPFGGMKASGIGRTRGDEGLHQFTELRAINWAVGA